MTSTPEPVPLRPISEVFAALTRNVTGGSAFQDQITKLNFGSAEIAKSLLRPMNEASAQAMKEAMAPFREGAIEALQQLTRPVGDAAARKLLADLSHPSSDLERSVKAMAERMARSEPPAATGHELASPAEVRTPVAVPEAAEPVEQSDGAEFVAPTFAQLGLLVAIYGIVLATLEASGKTVAEAMGISALIYVAFLAISG